MFTHTRKLTNIGKEVAKEALSCGTVRAISSVLHGNLTLAFQHNKLIVIVFPLLCYICIKAFIKDYRL